MGKIFVPDAAKLNLAEMLALGTPQPFLDGNCEMRLFSAIASPMDKDTVIGDFTEIAYTGYGPETLNNPVIGAINGADQAPITFDSVDFQPTGGGGLPVSALGYWVQTPGGDLLWCQMFASTFTFTSTSTIMPLTPEFDLGEIA